MAISFPTGLDNFTNPSSGNTLDSPSHSLQHSDANDAIEAIEAKLGVGNSPAGSATAGQVLTISAAGTSGWSTPTVPGLVQIIPTSVSVAGAGSSGSVDSLGNVTFTTATSISINNCFSSVYDNYRILITLTSSASDFNYLRLRVSAADNSTASSYISQRFRATGTTLSGLRGTENYLLVGSQENAEYTCSVIDVFSPFQTRPTQFIIGKTERDTDADTEYNAFGGFHNQSISYDGFTSYGTKSSSGVIRIYGYRD